MTNREYLNSLSDEEFSIQMEALADECPTICGCCCGYEYYSYGYCKKFIAWLKAEKEATNENKPN